MPYFIKHFWYIWKDKSYINPSLNYLYILCVINKNWLAGLKPDWFFKVRPFLIKNRKISLILKFLGFYHRVVATRQDSSFPNISLSLFLWIVTPFSILMEPPFNIHASKISPKGVHIDFLQIVNIRIIRNWPYHDYVLYLGLIVDLYWIYCCLITWLVDKRFLVQ